MKFWTLWLDSGVWRFKGNDDLWVELWIMNVELRYSKQWGIRLNLLCNPYLILTLNLQGFPCTCFLVEPYDLNVHNAHVGIWSLKAKGQVLMLDNFHTLYSVMWTWIVCRVEFRLCSCIIKFKFWQILLWRIIYGARRTPWGLLLDFGLWSNAIWIKSFSWIWILLLRYYF